MSVTELQLQAQGGRADPVKAIEVRSQWRLTWRRLRRDKAAMASAQTTKICGRYFFTLFQPRRPACLVTAKRVPNFVSAAR